MSREIPAIAVLSEMSSLAVAPKRKRGHERVALIVDTAIALFAERGYQAVTMTEVAARSTTAIGSLYRFFPTKEVLAQAIIERYGALLTTELDRIAAAAGAVPPGETAAALVKMMLGLQQERAAALAMVDAQEGGAEKRGGLRETMLERLTAILAAVSKRPQPGEIDPRAWTLLYALKAIRQLDQDRPDLAGNLVENARMMIEPLVAGGLSSG
jgi:AcrR family transcriptional regulator